MKLPARSVIRAASGVMLGTLLGIGFHGIVLSAFDGVQYLQKGPSRVVALNPSAISQTPVSPWLAAVIFTANGHKQRPNSSIDDKPWIYSDSENYYVVEHFPKMIMPCSYYAKLLGCRISRLDGKVYNRHTDQWESCGFVNMPPDAVEQLLSTNMTQSTLIKVLGEPLNKMFDNGGLETALEGRPCVAWLYYCQDRIVYVILNQSMIVGVHTNNFNAVSL